MTEASEAGGAAPCDEQFITRLLVPGLSRELTTQLDGYRRSFEAKWGDTDLTRIYTSRLSIAEQAWLMKNEPARYWDGLPKFFQGFIRGKMEQASKSGKLDDMPDGLIELYTNAKMTIKGEHSR